MSDYVTLTRVSSLTLAIVWYMGGAKAMLFFAMTVLWSAQPLINNSQSYFG